AASTTSQESKSRAQRSISAEVTLSDSPISAAKIRASWIAVVHSSSASECRLPIRFASACSTGAEIPCAWGTRTPKYSIFVRTRGSASDCNSRKTAAFVQSGRSSGAAPRLERVVRIEEDSDRAFIDQLRRHHGLKNSRGNGDAQFAQLLTEFLVKSFRQIRRRRSHKAWPPLPSRIAIQGELRMDSVAGRYARSSTAMARAGNGNVTNPRGAGWQFGQK